VYFDKKADSELTTTEKKRIIDLIERRCKQKACDDSDCQTVSLYKCSVFFMFIVYQLIVFNVLHVHYLSVYTSVQCFSQFD